jgi:hypothetical protein
VGTLTPFLSLPCQLPFHYRADTWQKAHLVTLGWPSSLEAVRWREGPPPLPLAAPQPSPVSTMGRAAPPLQKPLADTGTDVCAEKEGSN